MKSDYFLNVELTSNLKFTQEDLKELKNSLELNDEFLNFCMLFANAAEINFSGHLEIYIEDHPFEADLLMEIENLVENLDSLIRGGWEGDSKIEWITELPPSTNYVWFKDGDQWNSLIKDHDRGFLGEEEEWNDEDDYPSYDDRDFNDDY